MNELGTVFDAEGVPRTLTVSELFGVTCLVHAAGTFRRMPDPAAY